MKNPINQLATAAPRAFDSLLGGNKETKEANDKKKKQDRERTCSFDLDLSALSLDGASSIGNGSIGGGSVSAICGGSIAEEGSVVTFEDLSEFASAAELSLKADPPSPN
eukprot:CAMPEP_0172527850 /NCGR_PEP_ID=MMETSP1067-20121228/2406_1 /TAXON_ID=265564 ORGANISM="Thalassiosira punctigera, Strain Tpunct2005C2" /NCGR_SAMPLE_ID=MMETSP1067 /ASSEMBLY_ACC=CAM_ASM_000444 /LENGTH=108 /DNA_ID=CAMNT_0013311659 /DNA_START=173 /DNA_END=499 /DNA_ORIENTATION=+